MCRPLPYTCSFEVSEASARCGLETREIQPGVGQWGRLGSFSKGLLLKTLYLTSLSFFLVFFCFQLPSSKDTGIERENSSSKDTGIEREPISKRKCLEEDSPWPAKVTSQCFISFYFRGSRGRAKGDPGSRGGRLMKTTIEQ